MTRSRFDWPDLLFGLFLIAVAAGTFAATWRLSGGTAADMGPGYMPRAIALVILGFGLFFAGRGLVRGTGLNGAGLGIERVQARPILGVGASVGAFALLIETAGLAAASLACILIAGIASRETRFAQLVPFGAAIAAGSVLLFVKALSLPVPIWPW